LKIRVYYEDTDTGGVVYHSNYINFCERARSDVFFQRGLTPALENGHFVAKKIVADYLASAKLGDLLEVKTEMLELKAASFVLKQTIYKDDKKIFVMKITLVYVTLEGKPQRLDEYIKETVLDLFKG
jgi:acyl-CoA thioester hydrolase